MIVDDAEKDALLKTATSAMARSYSPYSGHRVGAALLARSQAIYLGANIGNACSSLNCCAEQVAVNHAVMSGETDFLAIAVVQSSGRPCPPCGRCLQLMAEFSPEMTVITTGDGTNRLEWPLKHLLPIPFRRI